MGRSTVVKVVSREISKKKLHNNMKKIDIYETYVNFQCQKLRASMRKMAQSDWSRCSPNWLYQWSSERQAR
jgi:hypothetical protein